jgi:hypothetical protein
MTGQRTRERLGAGLGWFGRALVLSLLLSVPAIVGAHLVFKSISLWPVCIVAFASIAAPHVFATTFRTRGDE